MVVSAFGRPTIANNSASISPNFTLSYEYGQHYLLASLSSNATLGIDPLQNYSDVWLSYQTQLSGHLTYLGCLELADLPMQALGTKLTRPDFMLSTGRFQASSFRYSSEAVEFQVGRANFFDESVRPAVFLPPINGDGVAWQVNLRDWSFKHVIESLPAERSTDLVFRRLLSYHHLTWQSGRTTYGAGEYFILTGDKIGFDLKRLNPFIPYSLNSHDSYADVYPGYAGDSDNSIIKLFANWHSAQAAFDANLYVDEFQIDARDRKTNSDAILLNIFYQHNISALYMLHVPGNISGTVSLANPNFGDHPGPSTAAVSAGYPLFESTPGMLSLIYLRAEAQPSACSSFSVSYHHERWVAISSLAPGQRNQRSALQTLPIQQDSQLALSFSQELKSLPLSFTINGWWTSLVGQDCGANLILTYHHSVAQPNQSKP